MALGALHSFWHIAGAYYLDVAQIPFQCPIWLARSSSQDSHISSYIHAHGNGKDNELGWHLKGPPFASHRKAEEEERKGQGELIP